MTKSRLDVNENIYLKIIDDSDIEPIFSAIDNEREYLGEWLPFVLFTHEIADTEIFVHSIENSGLRDITFAIYVDNIFAGIIGLKDPDTDNKKAEIGYWLSESYQHRGIVTMSAKRLLQYAFDELGMNRIQLRAATGNVKSQNVAKRLGFTFEGIERAGELHQRGFIDLMHFGILKNEFKR